MATLLAQCHKGEMVEAFKNLSELEALMSEDGGAAILDFWSPTCGPCRAMGPAFEALAKRVVLLGERETGAFAELVHPVHQEGRVFAWEVAAW